MLLTDISELIEQSKNHVAQTVNATLTLLYWYIGRRINEDILKNQRAEHGKQTMKTLSLQLTEQYGNGFSEKSIRRMVQFAEVFPDEQIVVSAIRQLGWSHFIALIPLKAPLRREFYTEMCRVKKWSVKTLRSKIDGMLFERIAMSIRPDQLIKQETKGLRDDGKLTANLIFRDPYFLDYLALKDPYSERSLEDAFLHEIEHYIMQLGQDFTFVERQKRMIIDGEDFKLDLLFFHRKLNRMIVINLKLGKFKPAYKAQMELYLRWLEQNEMEPGEKEPLGLLLCSEGNNEQIKLLELHNSGIKVAEYLTQLPDKELLLKKLQKLLKFLKSK